MQLGRARNKRCSRSWKAASRRWAPDGCPLGLRQAAEGSGQPGRASGMQEHLLHTSQNVCLTLSHQGPHSALSRSYPSKSLVWYIDGPPVRSISLQQGHCSFGEDQEASCRRTLEKQVCDSEVEAGPWPCTQGTTRGPDTCPLAGAPSRLKLGS